MNLVHRLIGLLGIVVSLDRGEGERGVGADREHSVDDPSKISIRDSYEKIPAVDGPALIVAQEERRVEVLGHRMVRAIEDGKVARELAHEFLKITLHNQYPNQSSKEEAVALLKRVRDYRDIGFIDAFHAALKQDPLARALIENTDTNYILLEICRDGKYLGQGKKDLSEAEALAWQLITPHEISSEVYAQTRKYFLHSHNVLPLLVDIAKKRGWLNQVEQELQGIVDQEGVADLRLHYYETETPLLVSLIIHRYSSNAKLALEKLIGPNQHDWNYSGMNSYAFGVVKGVLGAGRFVGEHPYASGAIVAAIPAAGTIAPALPSVTLNSIGSASLTFTAPQILEAIYTAGLIHGALELMIHIVKAEVMVQVGPKQEAEREQAGAAGLSVAILVGGKRLLELGGRVFRCGRLSEPLFPEVPAYNSNNVPTEPIPTPGVRIHVSGRVTYDLGTGETVILPGGPRTAGPSTGEDARVLEFPVTVSRLPVPAINSPQPPLNLRGGGTNSLGIGHPRNYFGNHSPNSVPPGKQSVAMGTHQSGGRPDMTSQPGRGPQELPPGEPNHIFSPHEPSAVPNTVPAATPPQTVPPASRPRLKVVSESPAEPAQPAPDVEPPQVGRPIDPFSPPQIDEVPSGPLSNLFPYWGRGEEEEGVPDREEDQPDEIRDEGDGNGDEAEPNSEPDSTIPRWINDFFQPRAEDTPAEPAVEPQAPPALPDVLPEPLDDDRFAKSTDELSNTKEVSNRKLAQALEEEKGSHTKAAKKVGLSRSAVSQRIWKSKPGDELYKFKKNRLNNSKIAELLDQEGGNRQTVADLLGVPIHVINGRILRSKPDEPLYRHRVKNDINESKLVELLNEKGGNRTEVAKILGVTVQVISGRIRRAKPGNSLYRFRDLKGKSNLKDTSPKIVRTLDENTVRSVIEKEFNRNQGNVNKTVRAVKTQGIAREEVYRYLDALVLAELTKNKGDTIKIVTALRATYQQLQESSIYQSLIRVRDQIIDQTLAAYPDIDRAVYELMSYFSSDHNDLFHMIKTYIVDRINHSDSLREKYAYLLNQRTSGSTPGYRAHRVHRNDPLQAAYAVLERLRTMMPMGD